MRSSWAVVAVALFAALLGPLVRVQPAHADVTFDQKMLELINQQRRTAGLAAVQEAPALSTVAGPGPYLGCGPVLGGRATDMGVRNYFSHILPGCNNQSVLDILASVSGLVYSTAAENIAWMNGTTDPLVAAQNLMSSLMNSPVHRTNILNPAFTHVGIGSWTTPSGQTWSGGGSPLSRVWITTQVFAQMPLATAPTASVSPSNVAFGDSPVGTADTAQSVTVTNGGSAALTVSGASVGGTNASDFTITSNGCTASVAPAGSCSITVGFTPGATGARSATLTISDNAAGSPRAVTLSGNGTAAALTGAPTNAVAKAGDGQLTVTWTAPASGGAVVGYGVFVYDGAGFTGKSIWMCSTCTSAVVTGLANGKQYYAVVLGHNGTTWGPGAATGWAWVLAPLGAPTNAGISPADASIDVSWKAPAGAGTLIDGFGVFVYDANGYTGRSIWACATCTTANVSGLTNGQATYAVIYPHNANGWGPTATSGSVVVGTAAMPSSVTATKGNGAVGVSWDASAPGGAPLAGYGLFVYDAAGYTGQSLWVCGTCQAGTITGLTNGHQYTVYVYAYNTYGWGVPGVSNPVTPSV